MKKVLISKPGSYDKLQIVSFSLSPPGPEEVRISCKACGVNFADVCVRMGIYQSAKVYVGLPITPGFEVSGIVEEVGDQVKNFSPGDSVLAVTRFGGYTSHLQVNEKYVFPLPKETDFIKAAAFPTVFLTAYYALFKLAHPYRNQKILVHSAAGGVGSALVQLAKMTGCMVVGVVGSSHKIDAVQSLKADYIIDKSNENLWKQVEKISPHGFDVILDANGVETLRESYLHLSAGGKLVVYGFHTMLSKGRGKPNWIKLAWDYLRTPRFNPLNMTSENHSVLAFNLSYLFDENNLFQEAMTTLLEWLSKGIITTPKITTYPLDKVHKAHQALESGETCGKIVLVV